MVYKMCGNKTKTKKQKKYNKKIKKMLKMLYLTNICDCGVVCCCAKNSPNMLAKSLFLKLLRGREFKKKSKRKHLYDTNQKKNYKKTKSC